MLIGYKLLDRDGAVLQQWGGVWGTSPNPPNPITLPNGDMLCGAEIDHAYGDYTLVGWYMDEPAPAIPEKITPRQCRLILLQQGLLSQVEAMIAEQDEAIRITWEYALEFRRDDPLLKQLAVNLGLTDAQIDEFFIAAASL